MFFRLWEAQTKPPISFLSWEAERRYRGANPLKRTLFKTEGRKVSNKAVFRIEKTRDYTVMSNHHLRDTDLSLKSKGLLSMMLSLPEDWNYTTRGLAKICKEGTDSIGSALKELERAGYIVRNRLRDSKGKIVDVEYVIYETPHPPESDGPCEDEPDTEHPDTENPDMDTPGLENRPQLNKDKSNPDKTKKDLSSTEGSNPVLSSPKAPRGSDRKGRDRMRERESYRELILENIEYVLDRMRENTTYVRNIKKYLLAALYNAPATIGSYYNGKSPKRRPRR